MNTPSEEVRVSQELSGFRIDKFLSIYFPNRSRAYFQYLIEKGSIFINGKVIKKGNKVFAGNLVSIRFEELPKITLEGENLPLEVLYEDEHLIAINKSAHMVTHPAPGHYSKTLVHALLYHCQTLPSPFPSLRPGIVHRLDKETSGILLAAKTTEAHQKLIEMFSQKKIKKTYLAICIGSSQSLSQEIVIDAPIQRHPKKRKEMRIHEQGKASISLCKMINAQGQLLLIQIMPITGRTHQIRVHLKHRSVPVLGDTTYGIAAWNKRYRVSRQMLHAHCLQLLHPITHKEISLVAPLPEDFLFIMHKYHLNQQHSISV